MFAATHHVVHGEGGAVVAQADEVLEPLEQLWVLAEKRRADLDQLDAVHDLLVVQAEAAQEVLVDLVVLQRLAHFVKEGVITE